MEKDILTNFEDLFDQGQLDGGAQPKQDDLITEFLNEKEGESKD